MNACSEKTMRHHGLFVWLGILVLTALFLSQPVFASSPTITSISPNTGPTAGGQTITITGSNFNGVTSVYIAGSSARFTVVSSTEITAVTPPFSVAGKVSVAIYTSGANVLDQNAYMYVQSSPPTISGISPNSGPTSGGQTVTITGNNFYGVTGVSIAGTSVSFTVNSPTQITATTPWFSTTGPVSVGVSSSVGSALASNLYTYTTASPPPTITSISPNSGPTAGGQTITISGSNFIGVTSVYIDGSSASFHVVSSSQITAVTPPFSVPQSVDVAVYTSGARALDPNAYTYTQSSPPTISSVSPNSGPTSGGQTVTITGNNFIGVTAVYIAGTSVPFTVNSPTQITATTPWFSTTGPVSVGVSSSVGSALASNIYTYTVQSPPPTISGISPDSGPMDGGQIITITGTNLDQATYVFIGGIPVPFTLDSATQITATTPSIGISGQVSVGISSPLGNALATNGYTYTAPASVPTITGVSPDSGLSAGGQTVTITGTNLGGATQVTFGNPQGMGPPLIISDTSTQITVTLQAHSAGTVDVNVTTPSGTATAAGAYTYVEPPQPRVTGISPDSGPLAGGQSVIINGVNFYGVNQVSIGQYVMDFDLSYNSTQITATTPQINTTGTYDVFIYTTYYGPVTSGVYYTYVSSAVQAPAPAITGISPDNGSTAGGQSVIISGTGLDGTTAVTFGGAAAAFSIIDATEIIATAPAYSAGDVQVTVVTPSGNASGSYTYATPTREPTITGILPVGVPASGWQTFTVDGTNFDVITGILFDGMPANFTVISPTQGTITIPLSTLVGEVNVSVVTTSGTLSGSFNLGNLTFAPRISGVSPDSGPTSGGQTVTITGTSLDGATSVTFGGIPQEILSDTPTQITISTTPSASAGTSDVFVLTYLGKSTAPGAYRYVQSNTRTTNVQSTNFSQQFQVTPVADGKLLVTKSGNLSGDASGSELNVNLAIENNQNDTISNATITEEIPASVLPCSMSNELNFTVKPDSVSCGSTTLLTWNVPEVAPGQVINLSYAIPVQNTSSVSSFMATQPAVTAALATPGPPPGKNTTCVSSFILFAVAAALFFTRKKW